jgi:hypothetical protein
MNISAKLMNSKGGNQYYNAIRSPEMALAAIQDINMILDKGFVLLGLKGEKMPLEHEVSILIHELRVQYPKMKLGELDLAFTLAARGELDFDNNTFQNFTVIYMNRMVTAYLRWANPYAYAPDEVKDSIPYRVVSDQEKIDLDFRCYAKFRDWENFVYGIQTYYILKNRSVITEVTDEIKKEVRALMLEKAMKMSNSLDRRTYRNRLDDAEYHLNQCRRYMVGKYFDQFLEPKRDKLPLSVKEHEDALIEAATLHFLKYQNFESILCGMDVFDILLKRGDMPIERKLIYEMTEQAMRNKMKTLDGQYKSQIIKDMSDEQWQEDKCRMMSLANYLLNKVA